MEGLNLLCTKITNAYNIGKNVIKVKNSKLVLQFLQAMLESSLISCFYENWKKNGKELVVFLRYTTSGKLLFSKISRISSPKRRIYLSANQIKQTVLSRRVRVLFISTSEYGVVTNFFLASKNAKVGGELLAEAFFHKDI